MQITNIGDTFHYQYDCKNRKLTGQDDKSDVLVKWLNHEVSESDLPQEFNHYDGKIKGDLQYLFEQWNSQDASTPEIVRAAYEKGEALELEINIDSSFRSIVKVNGEECLISDWAFDMLMDDIESEEVKDSFMIHSDHIDYNTKRNEIGIAVGESFDAGQGRKLTFYDTHIELQGNENAEDPFAAYFERMKEGLEKLFYTGKSNWINGNIKTLQLEEAFDFLNKLGIDTSRTFRLNGSKYEIKDMQVEEEQYKGKKVNRSVYYASLDALKLWNLQNVSAKQYLKWQKIMEENI